ncbi:hypothetical protein [Natranaerobius trueperi]|uniref:Uncharacterized protein n=1 Tax=Natranaerobius trueperi TaxID=759412 RepID=A0A226BV46_9FIRM|nr:hypothetical protein [Natranaerobius trueperi]OWZ82751.1 hypothetical protein CDO51_12430 [Natranaerobius trueperi]
MDRHDLTLHDPTEDYSFIQTFLDLAEGNVSLVLNELIDGAIINSGLIFSDLLSIVSPVVLLVSFSNL